MKNRSANAPTRKPAASTGSLTDNDIQQIDEAAAYNIQINSDVYFEKSLLSQNPTKVTTIAKNTPFHIKFSDDINYGVASLQINDEGVIENLDETTWTTVGNPSKSEIKLQNVLSENSDPVGTVNIIGPDGSADIIIVGTVPIGDDEDDKKKKG